MLTTSASAPTINRIPDLGWLTGSSTTITRPPDTPAPRSTCAGKRKPTPALTRTQPDRVERICTSDLAALPWASIAVMATRDYARYVLPHWGWLQGARSNHEMSPSLNMRVSAAPCPGGRVPMGKPTTLAVRIAPGCIRTDLVHSSLRPRNGNTCAAARDGIGSRPDHRYLMSSQAGSRPATNRVGRGSAWEILDAQVARPTLRRNHITRNGDIANIVWQNHVRSAQPSVCSCVFAVSLSVDNGWLSADHAAPVSRPIWSVAPADWCSARGQARAMRRCLGVFLPPAHSPADKGRRAGSTVIADFWRKAAASNTQRGRGSKRCCTTT